MIIEPKVREYICTTAHPQGCAESVRNQADYACKQGIVNGTKKALIIGCSTGYGLASRICALENCGADTLGIMFERPSNGRKTASPGWYNTASFEQFAKEDTKILIDPVMGDNGEEYPIYTEALCEKMRFLVRRATVITPNLTEALLLLYGAQRAHVLWKELSLMDEERLLKFTESTGKELSKEFDTEVVITGIDLPARENHQEMGNLICKDGVQTWVSTVKEGGSYSGTGDLFASVLSAGMVKGMDTVDSVRKAVKFLSKGIHDAVLEGTDRNEGICFERYLSELAAEN